MDLTVAVALIALHAVGTLALSVGQHARRRGGKLLVGLWVATCMLPFAGLAGTIRGLTTAFGAGSSAAPEARATMLADGISEAMSCTALGLALFALFLASTIVATVRTARAAARLVRTRVSGRNDTLRSAANDEQGRRT
jgi:hypothetical protein